MSDSDKEKKSDIDTNSPLSWLRERYFYLASLGLGGIIMLGYYLHIDYLPDLDAGSLIYFLLILAATGALFIVMLGFAFVMPGLVWRHFAMRVKEFATLRFDARDHRPLMRSFWVPLLPTLVGTTAALYLRLPDSWRWAIWLTSLACSLVWLFARLRKKGIKTCGAHCKYYFIWLMSWSTLFISLYFIVMVIHDPSTPLSHFNDVAWLFFIEILLVISMFNVLVVKSPGQALSRVPTKFRSVVWVAGIATVLFVAVTASTQAWSLIPRAVFRAYRLGGDIAVATVVTQQGCAVASAYDLDRTPLGDGTCHLENLKLRSRLGSEYLLIADNGTEFALPRSLVASLKFIKQSDHANKRKQN